MLSIILYRPQRVAIQLQCNAIPRIRSFKQTHGYGYQSALKAHRSEGSPTSNWGLVRNYHKTMALGTEPGEPGGRWDMPAGENMTKEFHRYKILANCGDYLKIELDDFRSLLVSKMEGKKGEHHQTMLDAHNFIANRSWSVVAGELKGGEGEDSDSAKNLRQACESLEHEPDDLLWAIREYASRNQMFHSDAGLYMKQKKWNELWEMIKGDLNGLHMLGAPEETSPFAKCIKGIRERYLVRRDST